MFLNYLWFVSGIKYLILLSLTTNIFRISLNVEHYFYHICDRHHFAQNLTVN